MNLTFYTIYFPVRLPVCHRHHLFVTNYKEDFKNENYEHHRIFCGHYPTFSYYPGYNQIMLGILFRTNDETFTIQNSFTVIDKSIIVSLSNQKITWYDKTLGRDNGFDNTLIYILHFLQKELIKIFFLQTKKTQHMVIHFNISRPNYYIVFDGPGFLSELLRNKQNHTLISSSFQCIIQLLEEMGPDEGISNTSFSYFSQNLKVIQVIKLNKFQNNFIYFPKRKHFNTQIIFVYARYSYHINVTISKYMSRLDISPHCSFGGLQFSENNEEARTTCSSSDIGKSFYSYNSSLTLAYYQYKKYDRVQIELQLSQTACKHIKVNVCHLYNHCFNVLTPCNSGLFSRNKTNCNLYLKNMTSHLNTKLFIRDNAITLQLKTEFCIILQFTCEFNSIE